MINVVFIIVFVFALPFISDFFLAHHIAQQIGITKIFSLYLLPSPVLLKISPSIAPTKGGTLVTIHGADMNLLSASLVEVKIGKSMCTVH